MAPTCADLFGQGNWVHKGIDEHRRVPPQVIGSDQNGTLKPGCHISPTARLLSSAIQFPHSWIWVTLGYHRHHQWIQVCARMERNCRYNTVLANSCLSRHSPSGVTNPPAEFLCIPKGDWRYRALRANALTYNWSLHSPGRWMIHIVPMVA